MRFDPHQHRQVPSLQLCAMTRFNPVESYMLNFEPSSAPMVLIHDDIYLKDSEGKHCYWIEQIVPQTSAPTPQLMRFCEHGFMFCQAQKWSIYSNDKLQRTFHPPPTQPRNPWPTIL